MVTPFIGLNKDFWHNNIASYLTADDGECSIPSSLLIAAFISILLMAYCRYRHFSHSPLSLSFVPLIHIRPSFGCCVPVLGRHRHAFLVVIPCKLASLDPRSLILVPCTQSSLDPRSLCHAVSNDADMKRFCTLNLFGPMMMRSDRKNIPKPRKADEDWHDA